MARILIVDDESGQRAIMASILRAEGHEIIEAGGVDAALARIDESSPGLVFTDLNMSGRGGLDLVEAVGALAVPPEVVVITAYGSIETSVRAMKLGAYDYLTKPIEAEELKLVARRALEKFRLRIDGMRLADDLQRQYTQGLVAESEPMLRIMEMVRKVADSDATVLILGESGTGKERIARLIHHLSNRGKHPLQAINCAAFPETLLESELFGYEKGAFTGANSRKIGIVESATGSTLFLDEVADMSLSTQAKILRVLQEREIRRVGGTATVPVDLRIIAATNKNLEEAVHKGLFREDLYYRLGVIPMMIPPLRERPADIPALVRFFVGRRGKERTVSADTMKFLCEYRWPGNIRELEAVVERMIILSSGGELGVTDLPPEIRKPSRLIEGAESAPQLPETGIIFEEWERAMIEQALGRADGVIAEAARLLGMTYRTLQYRAAKFGLLKAPDGIGSTEA